MYLPSPEPERRVVPLDMFPTGILSSVVVQKTYSANQSGEFGGGVVQLRTNAYRKMTSSRPRCPQVVAWAPRLQMS